MSINTFFKGFALSSLVTASILTVNVVPSLSQSAGSKQVTFKCVQIHDRASGEKIFSTLVWIPERQENLRLIGWKSNFFDKTMSAEKRCQTITQKFQTKYDSGNLGYITFGEYNGYPILCAVKNIGDPCNGNSQLFTLKPHNDPKEIQARLSDILSGKASDMLMQSSGNQAYIPFADVLKTLPVADSVSRN